MWLKATRLATKHMPSLKIAQREPCTSRQGKHACKVRLLFCDTAVLPDCDVNKNTKLLIKAMVCTLASYLASRHVV